MMRLSLNRHFRTALTLLSLVLILGVGFALTPQKVAHVAGFVVSKTADTNDGTCNADCSLREAITAANSAAGADTITFKSTVFTSATTGTITLTSVLPQITSDMDITGLGTTKIIIDGANLYQPFRIGTGTTVNLSGLTITHGKGNSTAGAIYSNATSLSIDDVAFLNNVSTTTGGAVWLNNGSTTITDSSFSENSASSGGEPFMFNLQRIWL